MKYSMARPQRCEMEKKTEKAAARAAPAVAAVPAAAAHPFNHDMM
jgi:hypothetical protein